MCIFLLCTELVPIYFLFYIVSLCLKRIYSYFRHHILLARRLRLTLFVRTYKVINFVYFITHIPFCRWSGVRTPEMPFGRQGLCTELVSDKAHLLLTLYTRFKT